MIKTMLFLSLAISQTPVMAATSWDNPAVMCPEEILAKGLDCPDFSRVTDVYSDYPSDMTKAQILDWKNNKAADLKLCRNQEVLKREAAKAGSYSKATIELAWMVVDGGKNVKTKLDAINAASLKYEIPPQVLMGAMKQESLMSSLGISPDGGNYSCGMSQLNIQEWCLSMNALPAETRAQYGWPEKISCDAETLPTDIIKPFYDIAIANLGSRASYELTGDDFSDIRPEQVEKNFTSADNNLQSKRFQAVSSFIKNCQDISLSIQFKARNLRHLFDNFVPQTLKQNEIYGAGKTFPKVCQNAYSSKFFPLHTGWLMAVAMYNAGPSQSKLVGAYYKVKKNEFPVMTPLDLIEALHWGGKYKKGSDYVVFKDQDGKKFEQRWFKSCIVQRHVARVIQHVTLPAESIAKSLETEGCKTTGVPEYRQKSSGTKN